MAKTGPSTVLSQHIDRSVMAEETLVDVLKNLSASYPPESIAESSETMPGTLDSTKDRRTSGVKKLSIPSLCLQHKPRATEEHRSDDRKHTEEYAAGLLARRLTIGTKNKENPNTGEGDNDLFYTETFESVKDILLQNINESFATLVDCRLRAYATFLARHGLSLARKIEEAESVVNIEQKLTLLLDVGNQITAPQAELHLHVNDDVEPEVEDGEANLAISLEVRLSLEIPRSNESVQVVPVSITSPGEAKITKDAESSEDVVTIDLDTHKLLSEMIHQASRVVAAVVDVANTASIVPESKLCRSSSFLAMPPPKAKNLQPKPNTSGETVGLELLSQAAGGEPCVVSPDMRSKASRSLQVPCLTLVSDAESEAETEPDLASLSPDQCADIVDGIFGEFDEAILEHPSKKHKVDLDLM